MSVTQSNKEEFVRLMVAWRALRGTHEQHAAFVAGFCEFVKPGGSEWRRGIEMERWC